VSAPADYDLNAVADALAALFTGVATGDSLAAVASVLSAYSEVPDSITVPALVLELDSLDWDQSMQRGADAFTFVATVLVSSSESAVGQRALRTFLSAKATAGVARLKAILEANRTLGGLVSYADMTQVRRLGLITFAGTPYLGAEIDIEVVS
jgi:hypothetical protein